MRGNGLQAQSYVAVADLDRRTADLMLAELRECGVAAYAADSPEPGPSGPVDRLYVDVAAETTARDLVDSRLHEDSPDEPISPSSQGSGLDSDYVDSAFADIVAGFHRASDQLVESWPVDEDLTPQGRGPDEVGGRSYIGWDDLLRPEPAEVDVPDPEDRYVPPPPPPVPRGTARTRAAWAAALGGPGVLFVATILGWHLDDPILLLCALAFLGGFAALIAGLRPERPDDDDDGAIV